jgi:uncharacterized protein YjdB
MSMTTFSAAVYSSGGVLYWPVDSGGYTLSSSDTAVATLTSSGLVVGHTIGTTEICATSTVDPSKSDCAEFHVLGRVNNVAITDGPSSIDDENPGQFYASVYVDQSSLATVPTSVRWYTDTPTIATVDASGLATAVSTGTATICAVSTYSEWAYEATQPYVVNLGWSTIRFDCVEVDVSVSVRPRS